MSKIVTLLRAHGFTTTSKTSNGLRGDAASTTQHLQRPSHYRHHEEESVDALRSCFAALLIRSASCTRRRPQSLKQFRCHNTALHKVQSQKRHITSVARRRNVATVVPYEQHEDFSRAVGVHVNRKENDDRILGGGVKDGARPSIKANRTYTGYTTPKSSLANGSMRGSADGSSDDALKALQNASKSASRKPVLSPNGQLDKWSSSTKREHEPILSVAPYSPTSISWSDVSMNDDMAAISGNPISHTVETFMAELPPISKARYKALVDIYGTAEAADSEQQQQQQQLEHYPLAPRLMMSAEEEEQDAHTSLPRTILRDPLFKNTIVILRKLLSRKVGTITPSHIWEVFSQLPNPGVRYLRDRDIDLLFRHFAMVQFRSFHEVKTKVFDLLDQCKAENVPLERRHWTIAITLAGRWARTITASEVKEAIETWMEMEKHGIQADHVVFNILFDISAKAGRFALADTIYHELEARQMIMDRHFRCSFIQQAGLKKDGDGVRQAFNDFVTAGEIVDTAVMNLVIRSLIRSDEGEAAEHVFENMKDLHLEKFPVRGAETWQERRSSAIRLNHKAQAIRAQQAEHETSFFGSSFSSKEQLEDLQKLTAIHPDITTYNTMVGYHALISGNIGRVQELFTEIKQQGYSIHGSVYHKVFWGFARHGGYSFSAWTPQLLETFWRDFILAMSSVESTASVGSINDLEGSIDDVVSHDDLMQDSVYQSLHWSLALVKNIVVAFEKCSTQERMLEVVAEIRTHWATMSEDDDERFMIAVRHSLRHYYWKGSSR